MKGLNGVLCLLRQESCPELYGSLGSMEAHFHLSKGVEGERLDTCLQPVALTSSLALLLNGEAEPWLMG